MKTPTNGLGADMWLQMDRLGRHSLHIKAFFYFQKNT
jgi:hypothetical protein